MELSSPRRSVFVLVGVFAFLTFLVWGLFARERGMFQDDAYSLALASGGRGISRFFLTSTVPTRIFQGTPFALALFASSPVECLQLLYGLVWLGGGLFAALVLAEIFPGRPWLSFAGGCLTICATSDYLADSLVALHYEISALSYVATLACLLRWLRTGNRRWVALSAAALVVSLGSADVAFAPILLTPVLLWLVEGKFNDRVKTATLVLACVFLPYSILFLRFLLDPTSYAATALEPLSLAARVNRVAGAYLNNFAPWNWGRTRRNWFPALPPVLATWIRVSGPISGVFAFLAGSAPFLRAENGAPTVGGAGSGGRGSRRREILVLAAFLLMALACNSTHGMLAFSQFFYRSQILSRYWSSLAVALAASMLLRTRTLGARGLALFLPLVFVGFGVDGGLDRQNYFLAYWKRHRGELRSIVESAPRLASAASLVLLIPRPVPYFSATQADYLSQAWTSLLYDDPSMMNRTTLISPYDERKCSVELDQIRCRSPRGEVLESVALSRAVILSYDEVRHRYALAETVPPELEPGSAVRPRAYNPLSMIAKAPRTPMARRVLLEEGK